LNGYIECYFDSVEGGSGYFSRKLFCTVTVHGQARRGREIIVCMCVREKRESVCEYDSDRVDRQDTTDRTGQDRTGQVNGAPTTPPRSLFLTFPFFPSIALIDYY
jgi:hypothetical protein